MARRLVYNERNSISEKLKNRYNSPSVRYQNLRVLATKMFNLILPNIPFLCPLKTSKNLWFSGVFRGHKKGTLGRNGLK